MKGWLRVMRLLVQLGTQSLSERIGFAFMALMAWVLVFFVGCGVMVVWQALRKYLAFGLVLVPLSSGCVLAQRPCVCTCVTAPDPRTRVLEGELERFREESRMWGDAERLDQAERAADAAAKGGAK